MQIYHYTQVSIAGLSRLKFLSNKATKWTDFGWNGTRCLLSTDRKESNIPSYSSKNIAVGLHEIPSDNCR